MSSRVRFHRAKGTFHLPLGLLGKRMRVYKDVLPAYDGTKPAHIWSGIPRVELPADFTLEPLSVRAAEEGKREGSGFR
jgi:hypothetical protein